MSAKKNSYRTIVSAAYLEQNSSHEPVATKGFAGFTSPVHIRVISYRKLNHDPDGVSIKAVLDGIVQAGILCDDSTKQVKSVTFESRKSDEEKTVIEITLATTLQYPALPLVPIYALKPSGKAVRMN